MGFSPEWLALREPADRAARDSALLSRAAAMAGAGATVLDLGSGTGSTARAFQEDVCATWTWRFVDGDTALLEVAKTRHPDAECVVMNLRDIDALPLDGVGLVTASALLDLMPENWITALATRLKATNIPFYAALNYDGQMRWTPPLETDAGITEAFNTHQRTDKGIGPAMGPDSGKRAAAALKARGFDVHLSDSPWQLGINEVDMHQELIVGIGEAAGQAGNLVAPDWVHDRQADIENTRAVIGHSDLLAVPRQGS